MIAPMTTLMMALMVANINGGVDYCNTTLGMNISFACFLVALPTTLPFYRRLSDARREALEDRA
eukprot:3126823-Prymnesium_polylepis.1